MAASYDPVELFTEVARTARFPHRFHAAADGQDIRIVIKGKQPLQPVRGCFGIVVQESHDV
ncbi:hypothetical protein [Arthrobacter sp. Soil762]|uniref:hypothetical protein n=1 Tax=Arthrobacter sp. Soil762 TaxID=1736401 RepID=UPI001F3733BB|nr:hypothetical protein [Arthrobacter sp. Soil762]